MADSSERERRRLGDATRNRIDDLAEGWGQAPAKRPTSPGSSPPDRPAPPAAKPAPPAAKSARLAKSPPAVIAPPARAMAPTPPASAISPVDDEPPTDVVERIEPADIASGPDARDEDATVLQSGPSPLLALASTPLREPARLPRQPGPLGDLRYVFTSLFGRASARREHTALRDKIASERSSRSERVADLARRIVADSSVDLRSVELARATLTTIGETQSQRAGGVAGADAELDGLQRARAEQGEHNIAAIQTLEAGLEQLAIRLKPLEHRAAQARSKAAKLGAQISEVERQIAREEASLVAAKGPRDDAASVEARLAGLRADGDALRREQPAIAAELDTVEPTIAGLTATRDETLAEIESLRSSEQEAQVRCDEKLAAVRARRAVEERAVRDVERDRDKALLALGEQLCVDRPAALTTQLGPIDEHEVTIATLDRRSLELLELVETIDKAAVTRGVLMLVGAGLCVGVVVWLLVS